MPTGRSGVQGIEQITAMRRALGRAERRFRLETNVAFRKEVVAFSRHARSIVIAATPRGETGELRKSTFSRIMYSGKDAIQMMVGQSLETESGINVAQLLASGTGIYGPSHRLIVPVNKKALAWPSGRHPVPYTRGVRQNPYFAQALVRIEAEKDAMIIKFIHSEFLEVRGFMGEAGFRRTR